MSCLWPSLLGPDKLGRSQVLCLFILKEGISFQLFIEVTSLAAAVDQSQILVRLKGLLWHIEELHYWVSEELCDLSVEELLCIN